MLRVLGLHVENEGVAVKTLHITLTAVITAHLKYYFTVERFIS